MRLDEFEVIAEVDEPLLMDQWYRSWIVVEGSYFYVTVDEEISPDMERLDFDDSKLLLSTEDHIFKQGLVGYFTNATSSGFFDDLYVEPIEC